MSQKRILSVAVAVVLVTATATGCGQLDEGARLVSPGTTEVWAKLPDVKANTPMSFGMGVVCLDRAGKVTIESATVQEPKGGLRVAAFAVRPNQPNQLGAEPKPLKDTGFGQSRVVDQVCDQQQEAELGVELTKPSDALAMGRSIFLHYTADGKRRTMRVPFAVSLCPPGLKDYTTQCPVLEPRPI